MSRKSEISIIEVDFKDALDITINGYAICEITYASSDDENLLIKNKDDAVEIAKKFVDVLEEKYGAVKESDYPNDLKLPSTMSCVEGYECNQCENEDEDDEMAMKVFVRELCNCSD